MKYEDLNERAKKDIIKTTKKVINFIDKYGIESIKFTDVSYFDCDDIFDYVINIEIENKENQAKESFSVRIY